MAKRKRKDDLGLAKPAIELTKGSVILGVGATAATGVGGSAAGLTAASGMLPAVGVAVGAGAVIRQTRKLQQKKRRR